MDVSTFVGLAGVPFITALVQLFKPWLADKRLMPVAAIILGVAINLAFMVPGANIALTVMVGVVAGLAASGLWSAGKAAVGQ